VNSGPAMRRIRGQSGEREQVPAAASDSGAQAERGA